MISIETLVVIILIGAPIIFAAAFLLIRLLDRLRLRDAETEAKEIIRKANQDVENHRREA
jgi:hypothetical protein